MRGSGFRPKRFSLLTTLVLARMQQCEAKFATLGEFIEAIGVSESTYWLLRKRASNLTIETLERIAGGLDMTVFELMGNIDKETLRKRAALVGIDVKAVEKTIEKMEAASSELESFVGSRRPALRNKGKAARGKAGIRDSRASKR